MAKNDYDVIVFKILLYFYGIAEGRKSYPLKTELNDRKLEIEKWLRTLEDTFLIACIRFHYLRGYSWKETSKRVYGYDNYYNARKVVFRYFGRE